MLFMQKLRQKMLEGGKTQTRRPIKPGEFMKFDDQVISANGRLKWQVGREYSVQYGRGKPTVWWRIDPLGYPIMLSYDAFKMKKDRHGDHVNRVLAVNYKPFKIELVHLRKEDVRNISCEDAIAEGFTWENGFWDVWTSLYDKTATDKLHTFDTIEDARDYLNWRDESKYQAWALDFKVVGL